MTSIARSMKRHGLTAKPSLRLISAVVSGDTKYYMFDISDSGKKHTVSAHDFWRGSGTTRSPSVVGNSADPLVGVPVHEQGAVFAAAMNGIAEAVSQVALVTQPPPPAEPDPEPAAPAPVEYVRVRDMQPGDVVMAPNAPKGRHREVILVVRGTPTSALHYVWEGEAALRTSQHVPGARFILLKRAAS